MARNLYLYLRQSPKDVEVLIQGHKEEFEILLGDSFSDDELAEHEAALEELAVVQVQPILEELTFEDLTSNPTDLAKQRSFFEACKSTLCLENIPYLENNPFQVTYLIDLLWTLEEALIDQGDDLELVFKKQFLNEIKSLRKMDALVTGLTPPTTSAPAHRVLGPIDVLVNEVYKELERLKLQGKLPGTSEMAEKRTKIFQAMQGERIESDSILRKSGLNPKDFGDGLEGLKFFLKKL